jgi:hypothetical protein
MVEEAIAEVDHPQVEAEDKKLKNKYLCYQQIS